MLPRRLLLPLAPRLSLPSSVTSFTTSSSSSLATSRPPVALVVGVGDGIGASLCRKYLQESYQVVAVRRSEGGLDELSEELSSDAFHPLSLDARKEEDVDAAFNHALSLGPLSAVVHNIGANIKFPISETTPRKFQKVWELAAFSAYLTGRAAAAHLAPSPPPHSPRSLIYTGATASLRGGSGFAAFAAAKAGVRSLAQSLARELGPSGVHVAHVVVDGAVDTRWVRENFGAMVEEAPEGALVDPGAVADAMWFLHNQPRCAWTHEMDLRPYCEKW